MGFVIDIRSIDIRSWYIFIYGVGKVFLIKEKNFFFFFYWFNIRIRKIFLSSWWSDIGDKLIVIFLILNFLVNLVVLLFDNLDYGFFFG